MVLLNSIWIEGIGKSRWRAVKGAGEQDPLLLPARQHGAHVAAQRAIAHRHCGDVVVNGGPSGAGLDAVRVGVGCEEGYVVGDRASKDVDGTNYVGMGTVRTIGNEVVESCRKLGGAGRSFFDL